MLSLILLIFFFALFNLSFRQAQRLGLNLYLIGVILYLTGGVFYLLLHAAHPTPLSATVLLLAIIAGVLFTFMYVLMIPTMSDRGVSLMTALQQLSVLFPMSASLLIYAERPSLVNAIGAGLCLVAMPFLALDHGLQRDGVTRRKWALFLGLMVVNGVALTASKIFHELNVPEMLNGYLCVLMFTAALGCLPFAVVSVRGQHRRKYGLLTLGRGVYLGLALALGQLFMLLSLRHYAGVVVYPLSQALNVSLVTLFSILLWREIPGVKGFVGIALAMVAVVLVNR